MIARLEQEAADIAFKNYIADSLQAIPQKKHLVKRYSEIIDFTPKHVEKRSGEDIANDVITGAGLIII